MKKYKQARDVEAEIAGILETPVTLDQKVSYRRTVVSAGNGETESTSVVNGLIQTILGKVSFQTELADTIDAMTLALVDVERVVDGAQATAMADYVEAALGHLTLKPEDEDLVLAARKAVRELLPTAGRLCPELREELATAAMSAVGLDMAVERLRATAQMFVGVLRHWGELMLLNNLDSHLSDLDARRQRILAALER